MGQKFEKFLVYGDPARGTWVGTSRADPSAVVIDFPQSGNAHDSIGVNSNKWGAYEAADVTEGDLRCKSFGHVLDDEYVEYADGLIVSTCRECGDRFRIPWFAGGTAVARVKGVVIELLGADLAAYDDDTVEEIVSRLLEAQQQLHEDREAIDDAEDLLDTARQMIAARLRA